MAAQRLARWWGWVATIIGALAPVGARAGDHIEVIVTNSTEGDGNDTADPPGTASPPGSSITKHTVQVVQRPPPRSSGAMTWFGLAVGVPVAPMSQGRAMDPDHVTANGMRACTSSSHRQLCTAMRGVDVRLQFFTTENEHAFPRVIAYLRSGYETGETAIHPRGSGGHASGEAKSVAYSAVPLFFGASIYVVKDFWVRPFAGVGLGVDVLKLRYARQDADAVRDLSARFGMEVHGGIEARITNYLAITAEVRQQWSKRRNPPGVPGFANDELTVIGGLSWGIPGWESSRRSDPPTRVTTVTRVTSTLQPPAPPRRKPFFWNRRSVPLPAPPAAAPPPVHIDPTAPSAAPAPSG